MRGTVGFVKLCRIIRDDELYLSRITPLWEGVESGKG